MEADLCFFWESEVIKFQNVISGSGPNSLTALETGSFCDGKRCSGRLAAPWTWKKSFQFNETCDGSS